MPGCVNTVLHDRVVEFTRIVMSDERGMMSDTAMQPMSQVIRPFAPADYPALAEIWNANYPAYPTTPDELRIDDQQSEKRCRRERWVGEVGGRMVGFGGFDQPATMYHPRRFSLMLNVLPDFQSRGIGSALYDRVAAKLVQFDPLSLRAIAGEDVTGRIRFLEARGFREESRFWESQLEVSEFDPAPFAGAEERVRIQGIEIRTMRELEAKPDRDRKLHELISEVQADMPNPGRTPGSATKHSSSGCAKTRICCRMPSLLRWIGATM